MNLAQKRAKHYVIIALVMYLRIFVTLIRSQPFDMHNVDWHVGYLGAKK